MFSSQRISSHSCIQSTELSRYPDWNCDLIEINSKKAHKWTDSTNSMNSTRNTCSKLKLHILDAIKWCYGFKFESNWYEWCHEMSNWERYFICRLRTIPTITSNVVNSEFHKKLCCLRMLLSLALSTELTFLVLNTFKWMEMLHLDGAKLCRYQCFLFPSLE